MSAASSQVPAVAASHDRLNRPLVFVVNKEAASRFPEKTSQWSTSQLVSQPRPLSLACHASRGSVSRLEEMADFHWSEQPPARPDPSLYVYYTYAPAPPPSASHPPTPSYELASTSSLSDPSSNSLLVTSEEMAYAMEMLDQFNEATELLEYNGQPFLALQADDQYFTLPLSTDAYLSTPETQTVSDLSSPYAQFPPISPPASSLPIPSCLRQPEAESTGYASGIAGEEDYVPRAFRNQQDPLGPALNWPPTSPDASSLPVPSWYASLASSLAQAPGPTPNAGGSSKDRAHRQNMMEKRRARRSSPNSTPRPSTAFARSDRLSERDNVPLSTTSGDSASKSGHSSSSLSPEGVKGRGGRRRKPLPPLYTFTPRENFEASPPQPKPRKQRPNDVFRYVAAPPPYDSKQPLLTRPL